MNFVTLAYAVGMAALLLMVDFGALRDLALYVNHTFLLDKAIHFAMYGFLALLANASLLHRSQSRAFGAIATGSILVLIVSTLEECSNAFVAFRTCSLADLAANYLGIVCLGILPLVAWQRTQSELRAAA
jgi:VanZ family protein